LQCCCCCFFWVSSSVSFRPELPKPSAVASK
jgi:hypothetical protein